METLNPGKGSIQLFPRGMHATHTEGIRDGPSENTFQAGRGEKITGSHSLQAQKGKKEGGGRGGKKKNEEHLGILAWK